MTKHNSERVREMVRKRYAGIVSGGKSDCGCSTPSCCSAMPTSAKAQSAKLGYSKNDLETVPEALARDVTLKIGTEWRP